MPFPPGRGKSVCPRNRLTSHIQLDHIIQTISHGLGAELVGKFWFSSPRIPLNMGLSENSLPPNPWDDHNCHCLSENRSTGWSLMFIHFSHANSPKWSYYPQFQTHDPLVSLLRVPQRRCASRARPAGAASPAATIPQSSAFLCGI